MEYAGRCTFALDDKRSPMLRLLQPAIDRGWVEAQYDQQWRTIFKAQRLGLVDDYLKVTDAGWDWLRRNMESRS